MDPLVAKSTARQAIQMQNATDQPDQFEDAQSKQQQQPHPASSSRPTSESVTTSAAGSDTTNHTRKRKLGDNEDDGPPSRRTSFQRASPASNIGAGFMPVNSNPFPSLTSPHSAQPPANSINGVSSTEHTLQQMGNMIQLGMQAQAAAQQQQDPNMDPAFVLSTGNQHEPLAQAPTAPVPAAIAPPPTRSSAPPPTKPQVGSEEWHRVRKDNHKEVERRRRETINEGINELAKIVPGCEKNKGSILQRTVQYINELQAQLKKQKEDRTVERTLTDQALRDLQNATDKLKSECERAWKEAETWKKVASSGAPPAPNHE